MNPQGLDHLSGYICLALPALTVALGLVWFARRVRRARRAWREVGRRGEGLCERCGYDLRATPRAGAGHLSRCPECGHVPSR